MTEPLDSSMMTVNEPPNIPRLQKSRHKDHSLKRRIFLPNAHRFLARKSAVRMNKKAWIFCRRQASTTGAASASVVLVWQSTKQP